RFRFTHQGHVERLTAEGHTTGQLHRCGPSVRRQPYRRQRLSTELLRQLPQARFFERREGEAVQTTPPHFPSRHLARRHQHHPPPALPHHPAPPTPAAPTTDESDPPQFPHCFSKVFCPLR